MRRKIEADPNKVGYIELPVAFDGLAVMVNPKNEWVDQMTVIPGSNR